MLDEKFENAYDCFKFYLNEEKMAMDNKIRMKGMIDPDSILGTYLRINPKLETPSMYSKLELIESDRKTITKYRTGSHSLKIQTGRKDKIARNQRLCSCGQEVQTIDHVLFHCQIIKNITTLSQSYDNDIKNFFENENYAYLAGGLESIEKILNM